jgi:RNA polymerase sigma-70 factor (ECF subfamily)
MRNEEEFIALVRANERIIYKVCSFYVSPRVSAEDLWQEVVANLWRGYSGFRAESAPSTWIYRIALNTCVAINQARAPFQNRYVEGCERKHRLCEEV